MERAAMWQVIERERADLADLLDSLTIEQWAHPSLCEAWTVREVGAHVSLGSRIGIGRTTVELARARGSFNRMVRETACREARRPVDELVAELRTAARSRHLAPGQKLVYAMLDVLIHGQDIAVPLGIERPMPLEAAHYSTDLLWNQGFPFRARKRLRNVRLTATDVIWSVGEGPDVAGPIAALLLLVSGRDDAALRQLIGPGAAELRARALPREAPAA